MADQVGLCECGCGQVTAVVKESGAGYKKGQHRRFISGHNESRPAIRPIDRITSRCVRVGECFIWQGVTVAGGYGQIVVKGRHRAYVHRVVYEHVNGPIPPGLEIDHVKAKGCTSPACCEPKHLEAVTPRENTRRSNNPAGKNAAKTHCIRGHELAGDNLLPGPLARGQRQCRQCDKIRQPRYRRVA